MGSGGLKGDIGTPSGLLRTLEAGWMRVKYTSAAIVEQVVSLSLDFDRHNITNKVMVVKATFVIPDIQTYKCFNRGISC